jgi:hypothetical protein
VDLSKLNTAAKADEGAELVLVHPATGDELVDNTDPKNPKKVSLRLLGTDSETFQTVSHKINNKRLERAAKASGKRGAAAKVLSSESTDAEGLEQLVACTVGWSNVDLNGGPLEFSKDNAHLLYTTLRWVREQAEAFILDRANFLGN